MGNPVLISNNNIWQRIFIFVSNMMTYFDIFLFLFLTLSSLSFGCPVGKGWMPVGESCYRLSDTAMNWYEAQMYCIEIGGYLAEITSSDENDAIQTLLPMDVL